MKRFFTYSFIIFLGAVTVIPVTNAVIFVTSKPYMYNEASAAPNAQVAIILGASVLPSRNLSPVLKDRVDTAIRLYESKKVPRILVSGDNGSVDYNEVNPVRVYLLKEGVLDEDILLDHAGFDTYSTMYRARAVFGVESALVVSQSFHLPRAIFIGHKLGIDAYGMNADGGKILFKNYIREVFANEKAIFDLLVNRKPKYLGPGIPIVGDGIEK